MSITKEQKQDLIHTFGKNKEDTGSVEVQCAIITTRVSELTQHLQDNPKDFQARRGLLALVNQRRKLLRYLTSKSKDRYLDVIKKLKLRK